MNAWFDRNRRPKMMFSVKIVKIGQLQMPVESREPIMHSGFFRLKHTYIIGEQNGKMVTKYAGVERVQTIKKFSSQNRIENLVVIILGRFPIKKTQN